MPDKTPTEQDWYKFLTEGETFARAIFITYGLASIQPALQAMQLAVQGLGRIPDASGWQGSISLQPTLL